MRIVLVGAGGREHALGWRLVREGHALVSLPGNTGLAGLGRCVPVDLTDAGRTADACAAQAPEFVVVGPEAPLALGLADRLQDKGIPVFGPTAAAARLESSKAFAKDVMARSGVPTAAFRTATQLDEAIAAITSMNGRCAVKADGLAAGKGVVVCSDVGEACDAAKRLLALGPVVIEERLEGPEVSIIALTDGHAVALLPAARDHKRLLDGDLGPNTGGMGAVCPIDLPDGLLAGVRDTVFRPVLATLRALGSPFRGALYAGLMLTPDGPRVLEFNARLGDPETEAIVLALSRGVNLGDQLFAAATTGLRDVDLPTDRCACTIVVAAAGYPDAPRSGDVIGGLDEAEETGAIVFHAGTKRDDGRLLSAGGRVLNVAATGPTIADARAIALAGVACIELDGSRHRRDIGVRP